MSVARDCCYLICEPFHTVADSPCLRPAVERPMLDGLNKEKLRPDDKGEKLCVHRYFQLP
jgi:hypothetical protein